MEELSGVDTLLSGLPQLSLPDDLAKAVVASVIGFRRFAGCFSAGSYISRYCTK